MSKDETRPGGTRREFIKKGAVGAGAAALAGLGAPGVPAAAQSGAKWDRVADVVVAGAGASGLPAAIMARDQGATVIVIDENHDIGGHAMLSGGRVPLGGGTSMQKKYGISDSADQVYLDHTNYRNPVMRYCDRDLVRAWADENSPTFEFLIENGVKFKDAPPTIVNEGTVPRLFITERFSDNLSETINGSPGSGLVRHLEQSLRSKGGEFLLRHKLIKIIRESPSSGKVLGITALFEGKEVNIQARRGVILATGGHTTNIEFRRTWDPRLTEEYQVAGVPWSFQNGDSEILAMSVGASLWATANQTVEAGAPISKTKHIGCRYGYVNLKWNPESPMFKLVGASGLTVENFQDIILVNHSGVRFWNEMDESFAFLDACLGAHGNLGKNGKTNGGGPIWAIFDSDAVKREKWNPHPPDVDPNGWFFSADTLPELAGKIANPYQLDPMPGKTLEETVAKYNSYVDAGKDADFGKPDPLHKVQAPPFYAAWSTPILHDTLSGLRINRKCQVLDLRGQVIPGLYAAGEVAGGFALHGLPRVTVFGRIAGREAALAKT
jgi:FAD binding domain-containing protein